MSAYDRVVDAIRASGMKVAESSSGARSQCPAHGSRSLSLAVRPNPKNPDGPLHVTCFAGCDTEDVLTELGMRLRDLYEDRDSRTWSPPRRKPNPFEKLIPNPEHFCDRILQQEAIEAGLPVPTAPIDEVRAALHAVDVAWARHVRPQKEYGQGAGDGYGEWSPERKADFAKFRDEVDARHEVAR